MEFSTISNVCVCVGSGIPFKLTRKMLDAIERMKQDDETTMTPLVKVLSKHSFKISTLPS